MNEAAINQRISEMFKKSVIRYLHQNRFAKRTDAPTNYLSDVIDLPKNLLDYLKIHRITMFSTLGFCL